MQHVHGIQTAFCFFANESLMSVCVLHYVYAYALKTNTCVFNNFLLQQTAWESVAAVTWACVSLCIGILSATVYLPVCFQFLGDLLRFQPLLRPPEQAWWLTFSQTVPCSFSHASIFTPGVSVPFFPHPPSILVFVRFVSCGSLRPFETDCM